MSTHMRKRANGEGSVWKRPDGRYCGAAVVDGKRRFVYGRARDEVNTKLAGLLRAQKEGLPVPHDRETVATFFPMWLHTTRMTLRPRTWARYESIVRVHILPRLGRIPLGRLRPHDLQRVYQDLLDAGQRPATVRQLHAVIHRALRQAVRWDVLPRNIADLADAPRVRRDEMRVLDADEVRLLLEAAAGTRLQALLTVAVTTGMRQGELIALRWREVDLQRQTLAVVATAQRCRGQQVLVAEPKTARSRRSIALTAGAVEALQRHRALQIQDRLKSAEWVEFDLVFPGQFGRHWDSGRLRTSFHRLLDRAGLPQLRFHDLRHTAATLMLSRGVHPKIASEMLGHSNIAMTLDLYSHVTPTMQKEAAATIDQLLWGGPS